MSTMTREAIAVSGDIAPESGVGARDTHDSLLGLLWAAALLCRDETEAAVRETAARTDTADPVQALTQFADSFSASGKGRPGNAIHVQMSAVLNACARDMRESDIWNDSAATG